MSSYANYCRDQAAECARRVKLANSPEVADSCRNLGLRWLKLARNEGEKRQRYFVILAACGLLCGCYAAEDLRDQTSDLLKTNAEVSAEMKR